MINLLDIHSKDGSRQFFNLQKSISWDELIGHLKQLEQLEIKQIGMYWFFVENPSCPDEILYQLAEHLAGRGSTDPTRA